MSETWRFVPRYGDSYEVSDLGNLRSWITCGGTPNIRRRRKSPRLLHPRINSVGYWQVTLKDANGRSSTELLHRLVLETFVGPCPTNHECAHLDGRRDNASLTNLEWQTRSQNNSDKRRHGTMYGGTRHHFNKLSEADVLDIRRAYHAYETSVPKIARRYGISRAAAYSAAMGLTWRFLPMPERARKALRTTGKAA